MSYLDEWDIENWSYGRLCRRYLALRGRKGKQARDLLNAIARFYGYKTKYTAAQLSREGARLWVFMRVIYELTELLESGTEQYQEWVVLRLMERDDNPERREFARRYREEKARERGETGGESVKYSHV